MAHRPLQQGVKVLVSEAELHQPSPLAPQDFFQHLAAGAHRTAGLALPPDELIHPGASSVELRGDRREVPLSAGGDASRPPAAAGSSPTVGRSPPPSTAEAGGPGANIATP